LQFNSSLFSTSFESNHLTRVQLFISKEKLFQEGLKVRGETDERPWGRYEVLEESEGYKVKRLEVKPGARLSLQRHSRRGEHWVVVEGIADIICGERELRLKKGEHIHIPPETNHRLGNSSDQQLALIEVQLGDYLGEDDIVRLEDDYKR